MLNRSITDQTMLLRFHSSIMHDYTLSKHNMVTRMHKLVSQNGGQKHLESVEA